MNRKKKYPENITRKFYRRVVSVKYFTNVTLLFVIATLP